MGRVTCLYCSAGLDDLAVRYVERMDEVFYVLESLDIG